MKDYANIGAVCSDCAKKAGFTPKNKAVGVWSDKCGICHEQKPCTNLHHDWMPPKKEKRCAMIKITNEIDGKKYELVPKKPHDCNECAFNGEYDCTIPKEHRYHHGHLACLRYCGIWKELKMQKPTTTEYRVEILKEGCWVKHFSCESRQRAIDSAKILNDNYQTKDFRAVERKVTEWEVCDEN